MWKKCADADIIIGTALLFMRPLMPFNWELGLALKINWELGSYFDVFLIILPNNSTNAGTGENIRHVM